MEREIDVWEEFMEVVRQLSEANVALYNKSSRVRKLKSAIIGLLNEPYGCPRCDSGVLRNIKKGHMEDCPYKIAKEVLANEE